MSLETLREPIKQVLTLADDVELVLRRSDGDGGDWWLIERNQPAAEIKSGFWAEEIGGHPCLSFQTSTRISDADVEGSDQEMLEIALAVEARGESHAKRCAVKWTGAHFEFWSPRNSQNPGLVSEKRAVELATLIRKTLAPHTVKP